MLYFVVNLQIIESEISCMLDKETRWRDVAVALVSVGVILGTAPALAFTLPAEKANAQTELQQAKTRYEKAKDTKKKTLANAPDTMGTVRKIANQVAWAETIRMDNSIRNVKTEKGYAPTNADVTKANEFLNKHVESDSSEPWGFKGDWKITPGIGALNSGSRVNLIFDMTDKSGTLIGSFQAHYDVKSDKVVIDTSYLTDAYFDANKGFG